MTLIDDLLELNLVERQLRGLQSRVGSAETFFNAQNRQMNELLQRQEELQTRRKQRQVAVNGFETDTKAMDERLEKLREELLNQGSHCYSLTTMPGLVGRMEQQPTLSDLTQQHPKCQPPLTI